jgi:hypothetical protein
MDRVRLSAAAIALAIPAAIFALNVFISFRERGLVEPLDVPAAIAFAVLSVTLNRGSRLALFAGAALSAVYLVTALAGGVIPFVAYWIAALVALYLALPLTRPMGTA